VDGVDEMRHAVRAVLRAGGDWIKLATTGGIGSPHSKADAPEFTREEIQTAVFEASRRGKSVMAHAFGGDGLTAAVEAGVRSIEHGIYLTEEQARAMAERGCYLVPTLLVFRDMIRWAKEGRLSEAITRKALAAEPEIGQAVAIARDAGVEIALGTDCYEQSEHGRNLEEIVFLHDAGLTPEEAL